MFLFNCVSSNYRPWRRALNRETRGGAAVAAVDGGSTPRPAPVSINFSTTCPSNACDAAVFLAASTLAFGMATCAACFSTGTVTAARLVTDRFGCPPRNPFFHCGPSDALAAV